MLDLPGYRDRYYQVRARGGSNWFRWGVERGLVGRAERGGWVGESEGRRRG